MTEVLRRSAHRSELNDRDSVALMRQILVNEGIEEDEILQNTPARWVEAFREFLGEGHREWDFTTFESDATNMVIEQGIPFSSICAHHLLPFFGHASIAYIPEGRVAGLSKLARTVATASLGLWSQEELCDEIMHQLERRLSWWRPSLEDDLNTEIQRPKGVAVVMSAEHTCMSVRGARASGTVTTTSSMCGVFLDNTNNARAEFMSLIK